MDIDKLITEVFIRAPLWDQTNKHHHNRFVLDKSWDEVAAVLKTTLHHRSLSEENFYKKLKFSFGNETKRMCIVGHGLQFYIMSGSPIPDVRHSAPFVDILLRANYSDGDGAGAELLPDGAIGAGVGVGDVPTLYPAMRATFGGRPTFAPTAAHANGTAVKATAEINSYYFYKTEQFTVLWVLFTMIVLGNSAVLVALYVGKSRKSRMNFFIRQLAIADLAVGVFNVSTDIAWRITVAWHAGNTLCKLIRFVQAVVTYSSTYVLVALSIDRYDAITHPMNFSGSWKRAKLLVVLAWMLSIVFSLPTVFLFEEKPIENIPQCWIDLKQWEWKVYMTLVALVLFVIPALIISGCYAVIVWTIWTKSKLLIPVGHIPIRQSENIRERPSRHYSEDQDTRRASSRGIIPRAKIKTVKMTFVIVFVFVICWSPYIVFDLLQVYGHIPKTQTNIAIATLIQSLAPLNSAANPVIYLLFSTHVCGNLRKLAPVAWLCGCGRVAGERPGAGAAATAAARRDGTRTGTTSLTLTHSSRRSGSATSLRHHTVRLQPALRHAHKVAITVV